MSLKVSLFALLLGLAGCSAHCINEVREELVSPDGKRKIVVFSRNCGATTGFSTQASVLERSETLPNGGGSLFVVDHGSAKISWKKDGGILVLLGPGVRVFKKEPSVRGILVEYRDEKSGS